MSREFYNCIKAAFKVGIIAAVINLIWFIAARIIFLIDYPSVKWYFVLIATMLPILLGGVVYYLIYTVTRYHRIVFVIGSMVLLVCSLLAGPLSPILPDGSPSTKDFMILTIPMHCVAAFMAAFALPVWNHLNPPAPQAEHA
ncbi:hypothetical protein [Dinghuibacter silviterrae]|uniref:Uncharacterized protein n=1 Tax=Dinghuibacter silviterrae TaxID=1539049 RepID=A0A4R8DTL4_9BACT|nr:hypothetical protein [Dinghuibacter silviterrae]TDX01640.1 hypothetical protein EDB95_2681 [Dinghuibacter silviterrae]